MSEQNAKGKLKYESPILVPLGEMAKGAGSDCTAGSHAVGNCTSSGSTANNGYCTAGTIASGAAGYCSAGTTATPGYCTSSGFSAVSAACTTSGQAAAGSCSAGTTVT